MVTKNLLFQKLPKKNHFWETTHMSLGPNLFSWYFHQLLCFASSVSLSEGSCLACLAKGSWIFIHWSLLSCIILNSNYSFFITLLSKHSYHRHHSSISVELFRTMKELSSYILGLTPLPSSSPLAVFIGSLIEWFFFFPSQITCDPKCLKKC